MLISIRTSTSQWVRRIAKRPQDIYFFLILKRKNSYYTFIHRYLQWIYSFKLEMEKFSGRLLAAGAGNPNSKLCSLWSELKCKVCIAFWRHPRIYDFNFHLSAWLPLKMSTKFYNNFLQYLDPIWMLTIFVHQMAVSDYYVDKCPNFSLRECFWML